MGVWHRLRRGFGHRQQRQQTSQQDDQDPHDAGPAGIEERDEERE
jgi:hypothetical protein